MQILKAGKATSQVLRKRAPVIQQHQVLSPHLTVDVYGISSLPQEEYLR